MDMTNVSVSVDKVNGKKPVTTSPLRTFLHTFERPPNLNSPKNPAIIQSRVGKTNEPQTSSSYDVYGDTVNGDDAPKLEDWLEAIDPKNKPLTKVPTGNDGREAEVKMGKVYNKGDKNSRDGGFVLTAPKTLYSATALLPTLGCGVEQKETWGIYFFFVLFLYLPLILGAVFCAIAQGGALFYVLELNHKRYTELIEQKINPCEPPDTAYFLRLICLAVFVCTVSVDFKESFHYFQWLRFVPNRTHSAEETKALKKFNMKMLKNFAWCVSTQDVIVTRRCTEYKVESIAFGGFTKNERVWAYFWGVVKFALEIMLLVGGTGYVLYADSNENLLLNSVSLVFISQIDDIAYQFTVTKGFKGMLTAMPDIGLLDDCEIPKYRAGGMVQLTQVMGAWLQLLFLCGASGIMWKVHCW
ncbi:hypothetical protein ScalyP_jg7489 [Parmales sp. scaly parma]|nr:hypothetical protein ScalyP_jg7489 [Parmales sp. scaly parma]